MDKYDNNSSQDYDQKPSVCVSEKAGLSFDYRPLVGFLTETIDTCILRCNDLKSLEDADAATRRAFNLERMDCAMLTLENTIQLILSELDIHRGKPVCDEESDSTNSAEEWLKAVFPQTSVGRELLVRYQESRLTTF